MKITFIYSDFTNKFSRGIAQLSACLKMAGYRTSLIHLTNWISKEELLSEVKKHNPEVLAVSFNSFMFSQIRKYAPWLSELGIPTIYGGIHPTVAPEECINIKGIDVLCRGEGEGAILDFCEAIGGGKDCSTIANLCFKKADGTLQKNPLRSLIENMDELPFIDYRIFDYHKLVDAKLYKRLVAQASRGCVYNCTYCSNHFLRTLYPNSSHYLRFQSVDKLLSEIAEGLKIFPFAREIFFVDDTLTHNKEWLEEFAKKYKRRIDIPYYSHDRFENIDEDTARLLKESGCKFLYLGIENGNEVFRKQNLGRFISNERIEEATNILKRFAIDQYFLNIIGAPGETMGTLISTVRLNARLKPTRILNSYFYPLKGTDAYKICQERGYLTDVEVTTLQERPAVNLDTISHNQMIFVFRYFRPLCRFSKIKFLEWLLSYKFFPYAIFNRLYQVPKNISARIRANPLIYTTLQRLKSFYHTKRCFRKLIKGFLNKLGLLRLLRNIKMKRHYNKIINSLIKSHKSGQVYKYPRKVLFHPTRRCNLACRMCPYKNIASDELSTSEVKLVFENIFRSTGPLSIKLSGGEVFLREDIFDILDYFDRRGSQVSIDTNGTLFTSKVLEKLATYPKVSIVLSIDGFSEFHNSVRGSGSFERDLAILRHIKNDIRVNFVILKENIEQISNFYGFMKGVGIYATFRLPNDIGPKEISETAKILNLPEKIFSYIRAERPSEYDFSKERLLRELECLQRVSQVDRKHFFPMRLDDGELIDFCDKQIRQKRRVGCVEMMHCNVNPQGELVFCQYIAEDFGNLKEEPFEKIWFSDKLQDFRAQLVKNNFLPICSTCCSLRVLSRNRS